jgi:hypothetical protein
MPHGLPLASRRTTDSSQITPAHPARSPRVAKHCWIQSEICGNVVRALPSTKRRLPLDHAVRHVITLATLGGIVFMLQMQSAEQSLSWQVRFQA